MPKFIIKNQKNESEIIEKEVPELMDLLQKDFEIIEVTIPDELDISQDEIQAINNEVNQNQFFNTDCVGKDRQNISHSGFYSSTSPFQIILQKEFTRILEYFFLNDDGKLEMDNKKISDVISVACENNSLTVLKWCLDKGLDIETTFNNYSTFLHIAAEKNNPIIATFLIDNGVDIDSVDSFGMTPIFYSYKHPDLKLAEIFLDYGASLKIRSSGGNTQFIECCNNGYLNAAKWLIDEQKQKPKIKNKYGKDALHLAASGNHLEVVKWLIEEKGFKLDSKDKNLNTVMHLASSSYKGFDVAKYLIEEYGADIHALNDSGETPISSAVKHNMNLFKFIVEEKGPLLDTKFSSLEELMLHLSEFSNYQFNGVMWLIEEKGVNINARNSDGDTALHIAIRKQKAYLAAYLISKGVDTSIPGKCNDLALHIEQDYCSPFYKELLDLNPLEKAPIIILDTLPEDWFNQSNRADLVNQLVSSKGFVQISSNKDVSDELMNVYTGQTSGYDIAEYTNREVPDFVRNIRDFIEIIVQTNFQKIKAISCYSMLGMEWANDRKILKTLNEIGSKFINFYNRKICDSKDILFVLSKPLKEWNSENNFTNTLLQTLLVQGDYTKALALINFEKEFNQKEDIIEYENIYKILLEKNLLELAGDKDSSKTDDNLDEYIKLIDISIKKISDIFSNPDFVIFKDHKFNPIVLERLLFLANSPEIEVSDSFKKFLIEVKNIMEQGASESLSFDSSTLMGQIDSFFDTKNPELAGDIGTNIDEL